MARITVEDCLEHVDNRFELVITGSKRARQLAVGGKEPMVPIENDKPTVLALREISQGLVDDAILNPVEEIEEAVEGETAEAEATEESEGEVGISAESAEAESAESAEAESAEDAEGTDSDEEDGESETPSAARDDGQTE